MMTRRACPTPLKLRFTSRREARIAAIDINSRRLAATSRRGRKRASKIRPVVYECGCGGFHLATRRNPTQVLVPAENDWL